MFENSQKLQKTRHYDFVLCFQMIVESNDLFFRRLGYHFNTTHGCTVRQ